MWTSIVIMLAVGITVRAVCRLIEWWLYLRFVERTNKLHPAGARHLIEMVKAFPVKVTPDIRSTDAVARLSALSKGRAASSRREDR